MLGRLSAYPLLRVGTMAMLLAALVGCSALGSGGNKRITANSTPNEIYAEAQDEMRSNAWDKAVPLLEMLEGRAAGTPLAQQAQLDKAYAYYKGGDKASAIATLDRFMKLHPTSSAMDYALYLKGMVNFNDDLGLLGFLSQQDLSERDQEAAKRSFEAFKELNQRFPESKYAEDGNKRMQYIVNSLAQSEVNVAAYYLRRKAYVAAINRAQSAIRDYPNTPAQESALYILVSSYEALGMKDLAADTRRVYAATYPKGTMLKDGLNTQQKPWWRVW